jgi:hypothetical protein
VGVIKVLRDVVVNRVGRDELLAVSNVPAIVGETLSLDLIGAGQAVAMKVRVLDSRPVIIDGTVRHRVQLAAVERENETAASEPATADPQPIPSGLQRIAEAG